MNRPTKSRTKAIVYSCCWQSVSVSMCVGNGCILRRVGECGVSVWFEQRGFVGLWQPHLRAQNIAANGKVRSIDRLAGSRYGKMRKIKGVIITQGITKNGYARVVLSKEGKNKGFNVHRLVAITFIPNPENKPCVNHIDLDKTNNSIDNLEWCTYKENSQHAVKNGRMLHGTSHHLSKLTDLDVLEIMSLKGKLAYRKIAAMYNVDTKVIFLIHKGVTWKHITNKKNENNEG